MASLMQLLQQAAQAVRQPGANQPPMPARPLGQAIGVEGYAPQDAGIPYGDGSTDMFLHPAYNNPQTSLNGMFMQSTGYPMSRSVLQGGSNAADPFGWMQQGMMNPYRKIGF